MPKKLEIVLLFAENLRRIRKEKGYSLRKLESRCVKIDNADLSRYEHADKNLYIGTLEEIAKALEVLAAELLLPPGYEIRKKE
ncbi:helix-turn-helix domain-containing protein [Chitinophaga niabensis]|uniref:Helix-turn-helix domain-containing protein n=1 Tax=Chitinophaga niabensis TaxID=536979 RepID=A0A1N6FRH7_9BACT|nr:helix-turn-helix transcriptional regulator [Chitinophaga niabensis]SIN97843.1 Helix-turn-helix domain-containing protein [Chitinophaga niabensis]